MSEFLKRRAEQQRKRRPLAEQVSAPAFPMPSLLPIAVQEKPAKKISERRVQVETGPAEISSHNEERRGLRFLNAGTTNLYVGGNGVTTGTAVIKLLPGDMWEELLAASAQWWAVSGAPGGLLNVMEIL